MCTARPCTRRLGSPASVGAGASSRPTSSGRSPAVPGLTFYDRGLVPLRGFPEPWRLVEVRWPDEVTVSLFGPPEIRRAGIVMKVDTRKAWAVLGYLSAAGAPVPRDVLAALLWPESSQAAARAVLRRTLSALRSAIGRAAVAADRDTLSLSPDLDVDSVRFRTHAESDPRPIGPKPQRFTRGIPRRPRAARRSGLRALQRGAAERFRRSADHVLERLAGHALDHGGSALAAEFADGDLLDPLNDPAHRQLMTAWAAAGDRRRAIACFHDLRERLAHELGVDPLPETEALESAIRRGPAQPARPVEPSMSGSVPALTGRDAELRTLFDHFDGGRFVASPARRGSARPG